jgi:hypothetical protein
MTTKLFVGYYKAKVYFQQTQLRKNSVQKLATNNKFESTKFQYKERGSDKFLPHCRCDVLRTIR